MGWGQVLSRHIPGSGIPGTPYTPARARGAPEVLDPGRAEALIDCALIKCSESRSGMLMRQLISIDSVVFLLEGEMDGASHPILLHHTWMLQSPSLESDLSIWVLPVAITCSHPSYPRASAHPDGSRSPYPTWGSWSCSPPTLALKIPWKRGAIPRPAPTGAVSPPTRLMLQSPKINLKLGIHLKHPCTLCL